MGRPRKKAAEETSKESGETRVFEVQPVFGEPNISQPVTERKQDNVIPFTGSEQGSEPSVAQGYNATAIDQFLTGYGIQIG